MLTTAGRLARVLVIAAMVVMLAAVAGCRRLPTQALAGPEGSRASSGGGDDQARWIRSGGMLRRYLIHLSAGVSSAAGLPVVIAFHGRGHRRGHEQADPSGPDRRPAPFRGRLPAGLPPQLE